MNYEKTMAQIAEATQALGLLDSLYVEYGKQASVALALLDTPTNRKIVKRASNTNVTQRNIAELFLTHLEASGDTIAPLITLGVAIRRMQEVQSEQEKLLERKKRTIKQLEVTEDSAVEIRTLSVGRNSIMVTAKTAGMKHPVTRHLRKQGSVWTGKPLVDFGESVFIQYHITHNYVSEAISQLTEYLDTKPIRAEAA